LSFLKCPITDQALRIGGFRITNIHFPNYI
jgi:hypothetical protein